jgi:arylsulfatase
MNKAQKAISYPSTLNPDPGVAMIGFLSPLLLACSCVAAPGEAHSAAKAPPRPALDRPNIVIVFLDDAGYGDFEHNGNPTIATPAISRLVADGASFTQFYSASPACTASRYGLLTGRVPGRSGLGFHVIGPDSKVHLHTKETTLAEGLKARGYATGMFGKWHLGNPNDKNEFTPDSLPLAHGFDRWIGTNVSHDYPNSMLIESDPAGTEPAKGYRILARNLPKNRDVSESLTGLCTEAACNFITENRDQPFFAYVALNMPHLGLFRSDNFKDKSRRGLLGDVMLEVDDCVAKLQQALIKAGVERNTLFILSSDNGPWIRFKNSLDVGYALPFRNGKGSNWEGGARVPGIFHFPGVIPPARLQDPASTLDILPTVFALAGEPLPADRSIDGRDIRRLLTNSPEAPAVPEFVYTYPDHRNRPIAIRQGPWKLVVGVMEQIKCADGGFTASPENPLLFQLEHDISERFNLHNEAGMEEKAAALKKLLDERKEQIRQEGSFWDAELMVLGIGMAASAQEMILATGKVTGSRTVREARIYTFKVNDSGKSYQANTAAPDVMKHEELFKHSLNSGKELSIEFDTNPDFPEAIRRIKKIEIIDLNL